MPEEVSTTQVGIVEESSVGC
ncbi:MAG: hypothetical protein RLY31_3158, partial [Bacteroidota bacterium]